MEQTPNNKRKVYNCGTCNESFVTTLEDFQQHELVHKAEETDSSDELRIVSDDDEDDETWDINAEHFECDVCHRLFSRLMLLERHKRIHTNNEKSHHDTDEKRQQSIETTFYRCTLCKRNFGSEEKLRQHMKRHYSEKECDVCGKMFTYQSSFESHRKICLKNRIPPNKRDKTCANCGKFFEHQSILRNHEKICKTQNTWCDICCKSFKNPESLKQHNRENHTRSLPTRKRSYKCEVCGKVLKGAVWLEKHMKRHTPKSIHTCDKCGEVFLHTLQLRVHQKVHQVAVKCDICDKVFKDSQSLAGHKKRIHCSIKDPSTETMANSVPGYGDEDITKEPMPSNNHVTSMGVVGNSIGFNRRLRSNHETNYSSSAPENRSKVCTKLVNKDGIWLTKDKVDSISETGRKNANDHTVIIQDEVILDKGMIDYTGSSHPNSTNDVGKRVYSRSTSNKQHHNTGSHNSSKSGDRKKHHKVKKKSPKRDKCDEKFTRAKTLKNHKKSHNLEKVYKCNLCGTSYHRKKNFQKHFKFHQDKMFVCDWPHHVPSQVLSGTQTCSKSVDKVDDEKVFECGVCKEKFDKLFKLATHVKSHVSKITCDLCNRVFDDATRFEQHKKTCRKVKEKSASSVNKDYEPLIQVNNNLFKCDKCEAMFMKACDMLEHRKLHLETQSVTPIKNVVCSSEQQNYANNMAALAQTSLKESDNGMISPVENLVYFVNLHESGNNTLNKQPQLTNFNTSSPLTNAFFPSESGTYNPHDTTINQPHFTSQSVVTEPGKEISYSFHCNNCDSVFGDQKALDLHKISPCSKQVFICDICQKVFDEEHMLSLHQKLYPSKISFKCVHCNKVFHLLDHLKNHMMVHKVKKGEQSNQSNTSGPRISSNFFNCDVCGLVYNNLIEFQKHKKQHPIKLFKCGLCQKIFNHVSDLNLHTVTDYNSRNTIYKCEECNLIFHQPLSYKAHKRRFHRKPFRCGRCDMKYSEENLLLLHRASSSSGTITECGVCHKRFCHPANLVCHRRKHATFYASNGELEDLSLVSSAIISSPLKGQPVTNSIVQQQQPSLSTLPVIFQQDNPVIQPLGDLQRLPQILPKDTLIMQMADKGENYTCKAVHLKCGGCGTLLNNADQIRVHICPEVPIEESPQVGSPVSKQKRPTKQHQRKKKPRTPSPNQQPILVTSDDSQSPTKTNTLEDIPDCTISESKQKPQTKHKRKRKTKTPTHSPIKSQPRTLVTNQKLTSSPLVSQTQPSIPSDPPTTTTDQGCDIQQVQTIGQKVTGSNQTKTATAVKEQVPTAKQIQSHTESQASWGCQIQPSRQTKPRTTITITGQKSDSPLIQKNNKKELPTQKQPTTSVNSRTDVVQPLSSQSGLKCDTQQDLPSQIKTSTPSQLSTSVNSITQQTPVSSLILSQISQSQLSTQLKNQVLVVQHGQPSCSNPSSQIQPSTSLKNSQIYLIQQNQLPNNQNQQPIKNQPTIINQRRGTPQISIFYLKK